MAFVNINQKSSSSNMMIERARISAGRNTLSDMVKSAKYWASVYYLEDETPTDITGDNGNIVVSHKTVAKNAKLWIKRYADFEIC